MSLDNVQSTIDVNGVVPSRGHYIFVVHYFNPDNPPLDIDVLFQGESFADAHFPYCPSVTGCRTIIVDRQNPDQKHFFVEDKYSLTFYHNTSQRGPIYIDSVTAVPYESFTEALLRPLPIDLSQEFVEHCSDNNYENAPQNVTDFCRDKIFSLTAEFNKAALSCDCNPLGATDFCCEEYGGVCKCKPNVIGRTCDRCAP
ncbi:EPI-1 protein, partial [Aphelenchoides avenae]